LVKVKREVQTQEGNYKLKKGNNTQDGMVIWVVLREAV
jgi:hypothetical protein